MSKIWNLELYAERTAIIEKNDRQYKYKEINTLQKNFYDHIQERCLIFILCNLNLQVIYSYISCINNNVVPVMLDASMDEELLNNLIENYRPKYIWGPEQNSIVGEIVYVDNGYQLVKRQNIEFYAHDELALLLSTSGSTGSKKLVRLSYKNIRENTESIVRALDIDAQHRPIIMLPLNYTYGLSIINTHFFVGATILLSDDKCYENSFWDFFRKNNGNSIAGVAYTYMLMFKLNIFKDLRENLKLITQSGEKLPDELYKKLVQYAIDCNCEFCPMYGQTEATARIAVMRSELIKNKIGSIGLPISNIKLKLFHDTGQEITENNVCGELVAYGESIAMGYAKSRKDFMKGYEWNGELHTGDRGYFDEDGFFYVVGRDDEYIKINGRRVNMKEVENILYKKYNEVFVVYFYKDLLHIYGTVCQNVKDYIVNKLQINRSLVKYHYINYIPLLANGKIDRAGLKERIDDEEE